MAIATRPPSEVDTRPAVEEARRRGDARALAEPVVPEQGGGSRGPLPTAAGQDPGGMSFFKVMWMLTGILSLVLISLLVMVIALPAMTADRVNATTGGTSGGARAAVGPAQGSASTGAAAASTVEVTASEFKFAPAKLTLPGPGKLTVNLKNVGVVEHDFVIQGVDGRALAAAGKSAQAVFALGAEGVFDFFCSIPGHKEAGMVGQVTVGSGAAAAAPAAPVKSAAAAAAPAVQVAPAVAGAKPLPPPAIAPPINRNAPAFVKVEIETREVTAQLADGQTYTFWTFGGTVPGPMVRVRQGDTVEVTLKNAANSKVTHSIDFHAVTGPGGGAKATQVPPGGSAAFTFKAINPGVYVYHCATPMVAHHISSGMYGLIVVEPEGGLPKVDREFYVMQGELYLQGTRTQAGHREVSIEKLIDERADFVLFNGSVGAVTGDNALKAKVGETVRIFFGVGGPNITSSFHVIGEIFDSVYPEGAKQVMTDIQTTLVPTGGATIVDFKVEVPGTYALVDHSLSRLEKGAAGHLVVEGPENPEVFKVNKAGGS